MRKAAEARAQREADRVRAEELYANAKRKFAPDPPADPAQQPQQGIGRDGVRKNLVMLNRELVAIKQANNVPLEDVPALLNKRIQALGGKLTADDLEHMPTWEMHKSGIPDRAQFERDLTNGSRRGRQRAREAMRLQDELYEKPPEAKPELPIETKAVTAQPPAEEAIGKWSRSRWEHPAVVDAMEAFVRDNPRATRYAMSKHLNELGKVDNVDVSATLQSHTNALEGSTNPRLIAIAKQLLSNKDARAAGNEARWADPRVPELFDKMLADNPKLSRQEIRDPLHKLLNDLGEEHGAPAYGNVESVNSYINSLPRDHPLSQRWRGMPTVPPAAEKPQQPTGPFKANSHAHTLYTAGNAPDGATAVDRFRDYWRKKYLSKEDLAGAYKTITGQEIHPSTVSSLGETLHGHFGDFWPRVKSSHISLADRMRMSREQRVGDADWQAKRGEPYWIERAAR
jgi:hypothetical protein